MGNFYRRETVNKCTIKFKNRNNKRLCKSLENQIIFIFLEKIIKGDAILDFGRHKGKDVKSLYKQQRHYLKWLAESDFEFKNKELERQIKKYME